MENPKENLVFVHEDFEKWPKASLKKTTLKNIPEKKKSLKFHFLGIYY
jgi:hypothetical protein